MSKGLLSDPIFHDAEKARVWLENRLWKGKPICPHCGVVDEATLMKGKTTRPGLYQCNACREPFTVTVGTLYERSKVPLNTWLAATQLLMSSKKGMSALQVGRMLGLSKKTAWFLCHRIRESVKIAGANKLGGSGQVVEADETYHGPALDRLPSKGRGNRPYTKSGKAGVGGKRAIVSLVERGGNVRSFHVPRCDGESVAKIVNDNIAHETKLYTDESRLYTRVGANFSEHSTVNHSAKEYARGPVHTNTIEGYFSIFKRGMRGIYQHCDEKHLHRYLAEFDFRYNHREGLGYPRSRKAPLKTLTMCILGVVGLKSTRAL